MWVPIPVRLSLGAGFLWLCYTDWDKALFIIFIGFTLSKILGGAR
jgi:hypothetical protein